MRGEDIRLETVEADNRCIPYGRARVLTRRILGGWGQPPSQIDTPIISVQVNNTLPRLHHQRCPLCRPAQPLHPRPRRQPLPRCARSKRLAEGSLHYPRIYINAGVVPKNRGTKAHPNYQHRAASRGDWRRPGDPLRAVRPHGSHIRHPMPSHLHPHLRASPKEQPPSSKCAAQTSRDAPVPSVLILK